MFDCHVEPMEKRLLPYCGMPVCLLMKDGSRIVGRMTACRKGALILNGDAANKSAATASRSTVSRRANRARIRASTRKPAPQLPAMPPFAPLSLEPLAWDVTESNQVPLNAIESVLIL